MISKIKNFVNTRNGDTLNPLTFTFKSGGAEANISSWEFYASVNDFKGNEVEYYDMDEGCSIVDNKLVVDFGDKINIEAGKYQFFLKVYNSQSGYQTIMQGDFNVEPKRVNDR